MSVDGRSHAELQAELNERYASEYLVLGGLLGLVGGVAALWLTRAWQVLVLSAVVGVALVAAFDFRNAPVYTTWVDLARDAIQIGVPGGLLLGGLLWAVHCRTRLVAPSSV